MNPIEIVGLLGTIAIFFSFFFDDDRKIRIGNMIGSLLFVFYGLAISAWSVWILNAACFILNLVKILKAKKNS